MAAVAGDGNAVTNLDGLMEVVLVRGKSIAGQLKLTGTGHPPVAGCDSAPAVRKYLLKILRDIFGDSATSTSGAASGGCMKRNRTGPVASRLGASSQALATHATPSRWAWPLPNA